MPSVNSHLANFATKLCFFVVAEKIALRDRASPDFFAFIPEKIDKPSPKDVRLQ